MNKIENKKLKNKAKVEHIHKFRKETKIANRKMFFCCRQENCHLPTIVLKQK